ncbi:hypothetical protein JCGZ_00525 [Jatropha curcas]|uniref:Helicase ATP-binding domain-containing protein n=1 Tax=Jatropha curcas TaxID=180498 RepID=A0A067JU92_JATCU|nr:hypothetical protein JCGZ_00525 [Jatropha curcas]
MNQPKNGNEVENEEPISDAELDNIVDVGDYSEVKVHFCVNFDPTKSRRYIGCFNWRRENAWIREQQLFIHVGRRIIWLKITRELVIYLNKFTGDATVEIQSTLQMARGGILADAMGLGKTIMTIALLLAHSQRNGPLSSQSAEIETHAQPGSLSIYVHCGQSRAKDAKLLAQNDVVITTYGILTSEFTAEDMEENGGIHSVRLFRVILDEAHTIKSSKFQISIAAAALVANCRRCLTATPIQNSLEDIYSLLRFLKVEPWENWARWNKLVQEPFEEGDERGLKLVQTNLKLIMLRRTKSSIDREGRPILVLPPADTQVIYCELTEAERDFYEALFKRSKVKFDQFVEQGQVLHNYAYILELLLHLRQCCDHPFLVMSRGDTQECSDLNKLAKCFLKGGQNALEGEARDVPSRAYVQEVVEELRKGEQGECPICLEAFEDAVLTPCAHCLCRECLLASW